jgi:hypothetical protein
VVHALVVADDCQARTIGGGPTAVAVAPESAHWQDEPLRLVRSLSAARPSITLLDRAVTSRFGADCGGRLPGDVPIARDCLRRAEIGFSSLHGIQDSVELNLDLG